MLTHMLKHFANQMLILNPDLALSQERAEQAINGIAADVHAMAVSKGWWPAEGRNDGEVLALMHSEISEALEAMRQGGGDSPKRLSVTDADGSTRPMSAVEEEMADLVLRVFDYCGARGLNIGSAIVAKMAYNAGRPERHGKKF